MGIVDIYNNNTDVDRTYGIKKVINLLNTWEVDLKSSKTLDMFAGDGSFCTDILLSLVSKDSVCWDIDSLKLEKIKTKHNIKTVNDDVISSIKNNKDKFDIIHCDNPSSEFGTENNKLYEYFDANHKDLMTSLQTDYSDEIIENLKSSLEKFKGVYSS